MPSFIYNARDRKGLLQAGRLDALDEDEVVVTLQQRGLVVTSLTKKDYASAPKTKQKLQRFHGRVTNDDKVIFCQQLATLLEAGIPLLKSLEVTSIQLESRPLVVALEQIRQDIEAGKTFRDALAKHPRIFSSFWVHLVGTGEASGHLAQSLNQLARYLESARTLQSKAITALIYPAILVVMAIAASTIFMIWLLPTFSRMFAAMHTELPFLTKIVMGLSEALRKYLILWVPGIAVACWALKRFVQTEHGRWIADRMFLKLPVFSRLFMHLQLAQFARGLGTLLESGVPILFSLEIMERSATNTVYGRAIGQVKEAVREGKAMAEPMTRTELFPPMAIQLVQMGEEIGALDKMLNRIATYYEERVDVFVERLATLFEPIAIVVMAVVIGTLVLSIYLPIFSLATGGGVPGG